MVEQLTRNEQVGCSIHLVSSMKQKDGIPVLFVSLELLCVITSPYQYQVAYFTRLQSQCKIGQRREQRDRRRVLAPVGCSIHLVAFFPQL